MGLRLPPPCLLSSALAVYRFVEGRPDYPRLYFRELQGLPEQGVRSKSCI